MFIRGQICNVWWPVKLDNVIVRQDVTPNSCCLGPAIIMLKKSNDVAAHERLQRRISSLYFTAVKLTVVKIKCNFTT